MSECGPDADFPDCPSCQTNVMVAKATDSLYDWQCWSCEERYRDAEMDHDAQREQAIEADKNSGEA